MHSCLWVHWFSGRIIISNINRSNGITTRLYSGITGFCSPSYQLSSLVALWADSSPLVMLGFSCTRSWGFFTPRRLRRRGVVFLYGGSAAKFLKEGFWRKKYFFNPRCIFGEMATIAPYFHLCAQNFKKQIVSESWIASLDMDYHITSLLQLINRIGKRHRVLTNNVSEQFPHTKVTKTSLKKTLFWQ